MENFKAKYLKDVAMRCGIVIFGYNGLTDPATLPLLIVAMGCFRADEHIDLSSSGIFPGLFKHCGRFEDDNGVD
jgi:hypothetical protein